MIPIQMDKEFKKTNFFVSDFSLNKRVAPHYLQGRNIAIEPDLHHKTTEYCQVGGLRGYGSISLIIRISILSNMDNLESQLN